VLLKNVRGVLSSWEDGIIAFALTPQGTLRLYSILLKPTKDSLFFNENQAISKFFKNKFFIIYLAFILIRDYFVLNDICMWKRIALSIPNILMYKKLIHL